jgi:hypothetical protein
VRIHGDNEQREHGNDDDDRRESWPIGFYSRVLEMVASVAEEWRKGSVLRNSTRLPGMEPMLRNEKECT